MITCTKLPPLEQLLYSGRFLLGANFRDFRKQSCFRENINHKKRNRGRNWWHHYVDPGSRTLLWTCSHVNEKSVSPLNSRCRTEPACYYKRCQQHVRVHKSCFCFIVSLVICGVWQSTGRGVVRESVHSFCKNKNRKNIFWKVWTHFCEILHQRKFSAIWYLPKHQIYRVIWHSYTVKLQFILKSWCLSPTTS